MAKRAVIRNPRPSNKTSMFKEAMKHVKVASEESIRLKAGATASEDYLSAEAPDGRQHQD